jgi:hypothetical protein
MCSTDAEAAMGQVRNTTFRLDDDLLRAARIYAAEHGTSVTALIKAHLEKVTGHHAPADNSDSVGLYSQGEISSAEAMRRLRLINYAQLLDAVADRGLTQPRLSSAEIERQASLLSNMIKRHP